VHKTELPVKTAEVDEQKTKRKLEKVISQLVNTEQNINKHDTIVSI
jgi:hypothetical protein